MTTYSQYSDYYIWAPTRPKDLSPQDSAKNVEGKISAQAASRINLTYGTTEKAKYGAGKTEDVIKMPAVSAVIFKLE